MFRMLCGADNLEIHHEYCVHGVQKLAALYSMGLVDADTVKQRIAQWHGAAIHYANTGIWSDSSNKLSWIIGPLADLFPQSRFLAIVRDGRKVVASFYYKLREEMYDDHGMRVLRDWLEHPDELPCPPPEKRYWWNVPRPGQPWHAEFASFSRLQRVAYHWAESNRIIAQSFAELPPERVKLVRLEDLVADASVLAETLEFIGTPLDDTYPRYLRTPRNVFLPLDFQLTRQQLEQFWPICRPMMRALGYEQKEAYHVSY